MPALPPLATEAIHAFIVGFIVLNVIIGMVTYVTLLERKFAARMQSRIGPYRVGPHGLLQPIADALKLMMKEDVVPRQADRRVYNLAPIVFLVPCMLIFATLPFAPGLGVADLNIGILFFLAVSAMEIVGLFMGGWGSNNKYALISAMRAVNQIISYDLPFIFVALIPVVLTGSLRLSDIAAAQAGMPFVLWAPYWLPLGPLAFLAYIVTTLAAENRVPFDILEAESELIAGFRVEYSGMKFALIQLGEYAHVIGTSFLGALLFLGAWSGPWSDTSAGWGATWFLLKAMFVFLLVTWIRWSFVRIRVDQILAISWKLLLPASLVLLMATGLVVAHYPTKTRVYPDRYRGLLALTYDKETGEENCIGCRLCEYICPPQVIKVEMLKAEKRNFAKTFTLELYACEFCELCVQVCPTDAIIMMKSFDMSTADRREMLLDKDRLHDIGLKFEPSWATGNLLRDMQTPPKAPKAGGPAE